MGILDEAIREHLELKRQHGADDSELKKLEDDAFGPAQRPGEEDMAPDAASEAATEFMAQPDLETEPASDDEGETAAERPPAVRREPVADVQEAPPAEEPAEEAEEEDEPDEADEAAEPDGEPGLEPADEEQPAAEHETVQPTAPSHTTEERHAIADQPTEMFDVEGETGAAGSAEPSDEELVAEEIAEPRLAPAEPLDSLAEDDQEDEDEEDFFDEQRLSDELDQALEAPIEEDEEEDEVAYEEEADSGQAEREPDSEEAEQPAAREGDEDVLEETPDFLEEAPEDDQLWFEQKPPKDFDFDD
jgi:hypothetical protein